MFVTTQPYEITQVGEEEASSFLCFVGNWGIYLYLCPIHSLSFTFIERWTYYCVIFQEIPTKNLGGMGHLACHSYVW